jgi:tetratricopeptide (TPR) repeat protein
MKTPILPMLVAAALVAQPPSFFDSEKAEIRTRLAAKDYRGALERARKLNQLWPDDVVTYELLVDAYLGLGRLKDAEKSAQWMLDLRIGKASPQGWLRIARIREAYGDVADAIDALQEGIRRSVDPGETAQLRAHVDRLKRAHQTSRR